MLNYGIILFHSTKEAMKAEEKVKEAHLLARIISAPVQLKASCGFALRYELEEEEQMMSLIKNQAIAYEEIYHASGKGLVFTYEKLPNNQ